MKRRFVLACSLFGRIAHADADLPLVEIHGTAAWDHGIHGGWGWGAGARAAIPITRPIRDAFAVEPGNIAFTAGVGWLYFPCPYGATGMDCPDAHAFWVPIGLAWSFPLHPRLRLFLEPGIGTFVAFFREACPNGSATECTRYDHVGLRPLITLGAVADVGPLKIIARAGFPTFSVGLGL